jgi:hypothetical protein
MSRLLKVDKCHIELACTEPPASPVANQDECLSTLIFNSLRLRSD